jgi:hypothetical protein
MDRATLQEFKTEVVNHHDYRYWGCGTQQEIEANYAEMSRPCTRTHDVPPPCDKKVLAAIRSKIQTKKHHRVEGDVGNGRPSKAVATRTR